MWLEDNLAQDSGEGICFKTLQSCCEKLTNPGKFKEVSFSDIRNREDCRKWLEKLNGKARTYTERKFCASLMDLLDESGKFFDEVGKIKPRALRTLINFIPLLFASYGAIIFAEELCAVYTLYFLILKGGQRLGQSDSPEVKKLGSTMQEISFTTAAATTTILVRLLEMTFWASHQSYIAALKVGSSLLNPLLSMPLDQNPSALRQFKTPELNVIAAPLEKDYARLNSQFLGNWRAGEKKRVAFEAFFFKLRILDKEMDTAQNKLIKVEFELNKLKHKDKMYIPGSETAQAIDSTEKIISWLITSESSMRSLDSELTDFEPESLPLLTYNI